MSVLMRRENTLIIEPGSDISKIQIINFILLPNSKKHFEGPPLQILNKDQAQRYVELQKQEYDENDKRICVRFSINVIELKMQFTIIIKRETTQYFCALPISNIILDNLGCIDIEQTKKALNFGVFNWITEVTIIGKILNNQIYGKCDLIFPAGNILKGQIIGDELFNCCIKFINGGQCEISKIKIYSPLLKKISSFESNQICLDNLNLEERLQIKAPYFVIPQQEMHNRDISVAKDESQFYNKFVPNFQKIQNIDICNQINQIQSLNISKNICANILQLPITQYTILFNNQLTQPSYLEAPTDKALICGDNDKYEGALKNGKKHGYGVILYQNGNKYEGNWKNDQYYGEGTFTYANGNKLQGSTFIKSKLYWGTMFYIDGTSLEVKSAQKIGEEPLQGLFFEYSQHISLKIQNQQLHEQTDKDAIHKTEISQTLSKETSNLQFNFIKQSQSDIEVENKYLEAKQLLLIQQLESQKRLNQQNQDQQKIDEQKRYQQIQQQKQVEQQQNAIKQQKIQEQMTNYQKLLQIQEFKRQQYIQQREQQQQMKNNLIEQQKIQHEQMMKQKQEMQRLKDQQIKDQQQRQKQFEILQQQSIQEEKMNQEIKRMNDIQIKLAQQNRVYPVQQNMDLNNINMLQNNDSESLYINVNPNSEQLYVYKLPNNNKTGESITEFPNGNILIKYIEKDEIVQIKLIFKRGDECQLVTKQTKELDLLITKISRYNRLKPNLLSAEERQLILSFEDSEKCFKTVLKPNATVLFIATRDNSELDNEQIMKIIEKTKLVSNRQKQFNINGKMWYALQFHVNQSLKQEKKIFFKQVRNNLEIIQFNNIQFKFITNDLI
ncbi:MORN_motif [Hexamita inflata]|uniref:MORN motif n=1 Tax=Hexamita inflata TaxID=28002 RepID=A0AA86V4W2_9EUKA|nr:MORN motif [Hexamita inflata]